MILTSLGLVASAAFAGAALYINWSEQPARMSLDDQAMLKEWKPSYAKGLEMQATLALAAAALGVSAYFFEKSAFAGIGGALMFLNWPFTFIFIMPTNKLLEATPDASAGAQTRALIVTWGRLHAVRTTLGLLGTLAFWAALVV